MCDIAKYGLLPQQHLFNGDDQAWSDSDAERIHAETLLTESCVVGIETCPARDREPGYVGIAYLEGFAFFTVIIRVRRKRYREPGLEMLDTRQHELTQFWATIFCVGTKELNEVLALAQPHPDDEEENR